MTDAGIPSALHAGRSRTLALGLRACAEELGPGRGRAELRFLSDEIARGTAGEDLVRSKFLSPVLRELLRSAIRSGRFIPMMEAYLSSRRNNRGLWRAVMGAALYPLIVLFVATVVIVPLVMTLNGMFESIFLDFGIQLPALTVLVLQGGKFLPWLALGMWVVLLGGVVFCVLEAFSATGVVGTELIQSLPLIGRSLRCIAAAEMCSQLAVLLEARVPLPDAFRALSGSLRDAPLRRLSGRLANRVERGESIEEAVIGEKLLPELRSGFRFSDDPLAFAENLKATAVVLNAQSRIRIEQGMYFLGPVIFVVVSSCVGMVVLAYFMPLVKLLNDLS